MRCLKGARSFLACFNFCTSGLQSDSAIMCENNISCAKVIHFQIFGIILAWDASTILLNLHSISASTSLTSSQITTPTLSDPCLKAPSIETCTKPASGFLQLFRTSSLSTGAVILPFQARWNSRRTTLVTRFCSGNVVTLEMVKEALYNEEAMRNDQGFHSEPQALVTETKLRRRSKTRGSHKRNNRSRGNQSKKEILNASTITRKGIISTNAASGRNIKLKQELTTKREQL